MDAGADDFLTKPLDRNQLAMRLAVAERLHALRARVARARAALKSPTPGSSVRGMSIGTQ